MTDPLLTVENLKTYFDTDDGVVRAVDDVSLVIGRGRTLGLVGESGSGKSVTAMSVIRLISAPGRLAGGRITLHGADGQPPQVLTELPEREMRRVRGGKISMIFQEPMTSLNPVFTVGAQIVEAIRLHQHVGRAEARERAVEMLYKVRIPEPKRRVGDYPHQFSGGMRQRAMIAMALACSPRLLIADEPTTALDVTIQAQILDLLRALQAEVGMSILMITHDLGIVAEMADDVAVMYASKVVERAPVAELFARPLASLHRRPVPIAAGAGKTENRTTDDDPRHGPQPVAFSGRLQVPSALCLCAGHLPGRGAGAAGDRPRASGPLSLCGPARFFEDRAMCRHSTRAQVRVSRSVT